MEKIINCPCCGEKTLTEQGGYEVCQLCYWEDDPGQHEHPDDDLGANGISLNEYRRKWNAKRQA